MSIDVKTCKYYLPCGTCDRTGKDCTCNDMFKTDKVVIHPIKPITEITEEDKTNANKVTDKYEDLLAELLKNWKQIKPYEIHYSDWATTSNVNYSCCEHCSNNPKNGGSGICNCVLPYMESQRTGGKPVTWTTTTNTTGDYVTLLNPVTSSNDWCINSTKE